MDRRFSVCKPTSKFRYLVQQVNEQCPLCDFTLKVGFWKKRYHRCVLVTCPYFDKAIRGNFIEKQKGLVDVGVGTPDTVDSAIMYLYGILPDIHLQNVGPLLEQAEYFMIAGLKSICIKWIRSLKITKNNYIYVLKLSSVYNFEVPACMMYIESILPEVFRAEEALYFSKELVKKLFTDERLSYVTMDEKLSFLMYWVSRNPDESKSDVTELFETIDINDVTEPVWQQASQNSPFKEKVDVDNVVRWYRGSEYKSDVLIMSGKEGSLLCLNLQNDTWYQIKTSLPENSYDSRYKNIAGVRNTKPEVYFAECGIRMVPSLTTLDIETNERKHFEFTLKDAEISRETITNICLADKTLLVLTRKHVQMIETYESMQTGNDNFHNCPGPSTSTTCSESSRRRKVRVPVICENGRLYPAQIINNNHIIDVSDTIHTAVHIGNVTNEIVEIVPIFYLRDIEISQACVNSILSTIALLPKEKEYVILFDLVNFKMEKYLLEQDAQYTICTTNKGFVIYNNKRCYCLTAIYWSLPSQHYWMELFELKTDGRKLEYLFCNGFWIRYYNRVSNIDFEMSYVRHDELLKSGNPEDLKWKCISIPDKNLENMLSLKKGVFVVQLSKRKLRCHIHCPHCKCSQPESPKGRVRCCTFNFL